VRPEELAAYLDGKLRPEERQIAERHLLVCAECRQDLAEAAELGAGPRRSAWVKLGVPFAVAAVLTLAVIGRGDRVPAPEAGPPVLRGPQAEGTRALASVGPANRAGVTLDSLVFRWRSAGGQAHYVLTVTDQAGDVTWTTSTSDTSVALPPGVGLRSGERYYWYVDALLEGATSFTTGVREFIVR
jgi:hypothetical protein